MRNTLPALATTLVLAALAYMLDLPRLGGAHPWWSQKVILIGLLPGLAIAAALSLTGLRKPGRVGLVAVGTAVAVAITIVGKTRFAASYAEDALAGQMWYFGWIATCALCTALVASAVWPTALRD
jgi:hypothetical protein